MAPPSSRWTLPLRHQPALRSGAVLAAILLFLGLAVALARAGSPGQERAIVRVYFADQATLNSLAGRFDVWEVNRPQGFAVVALPPAIIPSLRQAGLRVEVDAARTRMALTPGDRSCYRSVEAVEADLRATSAAHLDLATLIDYGDSWEKMRSSGQAGYDLWVLKLTNRNVPGPKPRFFLMSEIHARELTTPETAMAFAHYLLDHYGTDPDVTWLLDYQEVYIAPMTNPDGHKLAEQGVLWRKNTNNSNGCASYPDYGTDLNRNADFKWDACPSCSSTAPCDETYRGPTAASEPETQALQTYLRYLFPDQRGSSDADAAPEDATGVFISLHSYGNEILWPWGFTDQPAPNAVGLEAIGRKLARLNGYAAGQASRTLYLSAGTTDEYVYGQMGVAAFTIEMGDTFFQDCSALPGIEAANLKALLYAARIARTPYLTARGPDVRPVSLQVTPADRTQGVILAVQVDDTGNGGQAIARAELTVDTPFWAGGTAIPLTAADGAFDSSLEVASGVLNTTGLASGRHTLFIRGQDSAGNWGPVTAEYFSIPLYASLAYFVGASADNRVILSWATDYEMNLVGFDVLRARKPAASQAAEFEKINKDLIPASSGSGSVAHYTFVDTGVTRGATYLYLLEDVDTSGARTQHGPIEVTPGSVYLPVIISRPD